MRARSLWTVLFLPFIAVGSIGPTAVHGDGGLIDGIKKRLSGKMTSSGSGGHVHSEANTDHDSSSSEEEATGTTVAEQEQQALQKTSMVCDDILVLNLAKANEKATKAEKERDEALQNESTALDRIAALEVQVTQLEAMLAKERAAHERAESEAELAIQIIESTAEQKVLAQNQESTRQLEKQSQKLTAEMKTLEQEKDDIIASLKNKLKMNSIELQRKLEEEVKRAHEDRDQKLADMQQKMEETVAAVEEDRDAKVAELTATIKTTLVEAAETLATTKEEAKLQLLSQVSAVKETLAKTKRDHEQVLKDKNEKIQKLEAYTSQVLKTNQDKERALVVAEAELMHWRALDANRTYCNMTHIKSDLYDASAKVYAEAVETAKGFGYQMHLHGKQLYTDMGKRVAAGSVKVREIYQKQVDQHWLTVQPLYEEHVLGNYKKLGPHLDEHIRPRIKQATQWYERVVAPELSMLGKEFSKQRSKSFENAARWYGKNCLAGLQSYRTSMRETEALQKTPDYVLKAWNDSCSHPEESLEATLKGFVILSVLIFWRRILNSILWILLTITPLGLIFSKPSSRRQKQKGTLDVVTSGSSSVATAGENGQNGQHENAMLSHVKTRAQRKEAQSVRKESKNETDD